MNPRVVLRVILGVLFIPATLLVVLRPCTPRFAVAVDAPNMLPVAAGILGTLVFRTVREDAFLHRGLQGYAPCAQQTRYRLLPGVW